MVLWMGDHWIFLTGCGALLIGSVGLTGYWIYGKLVSLNSKYQDYEYCILPTTNQSIFIPPSPKQKTLLAVPALLRQASFKKDEELGDVEVPYELDRRNV